MGRFNKIILGFLFLMNIIKSKAAEVVTQTPAPAPEPNGLAVIWNIIKWPLLILVILVILTYIAVRIILAVLKWLKLKDNEAQKTVLMKISLARSQHKKRYPSSIIKWRKNAPIYIFYKNNKGDLSKELFGVYMGDFTDNENITWLNFANKSLHFLLWFIPKIETIMCPQNSVMKITKIKDIVKQEFEETSVNINPIKVHFLSDEVLIETTHIDKVSDEFDMYIPVIKNDKGDIVDPTQAIFQTVENLVLKKVQYDILNSYAMNVKKGMEMNVVLKGKQKLGDTEGTME